MAVIYLFLSAQTYPLHYAFKQLHRIGFPYQQPMSHLAFSITVNRVLRFHRQVYTISHCFYSSHDWSPILIFALNEQCFSSEGVFFKLFEYKFSKRADLSL